MICAEYPLSSRSRLSLVRVLAGQLSAASRSLSQRRLCCPLAQRCAAAAAAAAVAGNQMINLGRVRFASRATTTTTADAPDRRRRADSSGESAAAASERVSGASRKPNAADERHHLLARHGQRAAFAALRCAAPSPRRASPLPLRSPGRRAAQLSSDATKWAATHSLTLVCRRRSPCETLFGGGGALPT